MQPTRSSTALQRNQRLQLRQRNGEHTRHFWNNGNTKNTRNNHNTNIRAPGRCRVTYTLSLTHTRAFSLSLSRSLSLTLAPSLSLSLSRSLYFSLALSLSLLLSRSISRSTPLFLRNVSRSSAFTPFDVGRGWACMTCRPNPTRPKTKLRVFRYDPTFTYNILTERNP